MTPATIMGLIRKRLPLPDLALALDVDATFTELHLNAVDGWAIAVDIEDELGRELDWKRVEHWASVRDVIETVDALTKEKLT